MIIILSLINSVCLSQNWEPLGPDSVPGLIHPNDYSLKIAHGIGRVTMLRFEPSKNSTTAKMFMGSPYGGLWQSSDKAKTWSPVATDHLPNLGIADLAINPKKPQIMYISTGDPDCTMDPNGPALSCESCQSRGIVKSVDGGLTWTINAIGTWYDTSGTEIKDFWKFPSYKIMRRLLINPRKPDVLYAILYTYSYITRTYDGYVYKSKDAGSNWYVSLFVRNGMFKDIEFKPGNPDVLYAGGKTIYKTKDGGKNWSSLEDHGLPADSISGRCEIAMCPNAPTKVFALIVNRKTKQNDFFISDDDGKSFNKIISGAGSPEWRTTFAVNPSDPGQIFFSAGNRVSRFMQRNNSWKVTTAGGSIHDDLHDLTFDPPGRILYASTDGGLYASADTGKNWVSCSLGLNIAECWSVAVSQSDTLTLLSGLQDCGTIRYRDVPDSTGGWFALRGGDGMESVINYTNDRTFYYNDGNNNILGRSEDGGVNWSRNLSVRNMAGAYIRPFIMNTKNPEILYTAYNEVFVSYDKGENWKQLSGFKKLGVVDMVCALAVSPSDSSVIYAAVCNPSWNFTPEKKIFRTGDGGQTWQDVTKGLTGVSSTNISFITVHPQNPDIVYVGFRGAWRIKIMRSLSGGMGQDPWQDFTAGLPEDADVNTMIFDRDEHATLYAGTHVGVYRCNEDESVWSDFNKGLPRVMVMDLDIRFRYHELYAGTHGRGIWRVKLAGDH